MDDRLESNLLIVPTMTMNEQGEAHDASRTNVRRASLFSFRRNGLQIIFRRPTSSCSTPPGIMPNADRDPKAEYLAEHIPGAVFFDIDAIADHSTDLPHMLPDPVAFSSAMRKLGFGDGMRAVVYDSVGLFSAPRLWWTLTPSGSSTCPFSKAACRNGKRNIAHSRRARRRAVRVTSRRGSIIASSPTPRMCKRRWLDRSAQVVDVRSADRFRGVAPEPRPGLRSGHMPGAPTCP